MALGSSGEMIAERTLVCRRTNGDRIPVTLARSTIGYLEKLVRQGITPGVMVSPNTLSKDAANAQNDANYEALWARLRAR